MIEPDLHCLGCGETMQSFLSLNLTLQSSVNRNLETYADSEKTFLSGLAKHLFKYQLEQLTSD